MSEIILAGGRSLQVAESRADIMRRISNALLESDPVIEVLVVSRAGGASVAVREDLASVFANHVQAVVE